MQDPELATADWYKDAIIYEVHVRAFADSDGDGIGDFQGLTAKLDYLQDLGVTALWLLPFYPSPLKDDGYDIADYTAVHPSYGTLADFKQFMREAHRRGLRVITELVLNHTSDQHPWFQRARRAAPGSALRNFYVWSDDPERYQQARIIFPDFEHSNWSWDHVANAYFWHRFYSHQPDLNFDSPQVRRAVLRVVDFWLKLGVDGLRLDAVPYLYEAEETTSENLQPTHGFLKTLRAHIDQRFPGRMLLAEANQWPEDAVAYFGTGDECHMAFHFPLMPRLFMALQMEDRFPVVDILAQTPPIPDSCQWAIFLRNHDELTLEMVTDDERVFMYRSYAHDDEARINMGIRRRLATLMRNNRRRIELMNSLLLALPGTPVLYYGDEIGMGDNMFLGDRNGVRTPMQWSPDRNAGFSQANPQRLYLPLVLDHEYHYETVNVEAQQQNPQSLLAWMRRLIALRKRHPAFGRGTMEVLESDNPCVLAFVRSWGTENVLVVANLSRFAQVATLDLGRFTGMSVVELFGLGAFPPIREEAYQLTLGAHNFFWCALQPVAEAAPTDAAQVRPLPRLTLTGPWTTLLNSRAHTAIEELLPSYLQASAWFGGKARQIIGLHLIDAIALPFGAHQAYLTIWRVDYVVGESEQYTLPLAVARGNQAEELELRMPEALVARLTFQQAGQVSEGLLYDAFWAPGFAEALLNMIVSRERPCGQYGEVAGKTYTALAAAEASTPREVVQLVSGAQNNTSVTFDDRLVLKLLRHIEDGISPELELGTFLQRHDFAYAPALLGALTYRSARSQPTTLAVLHRYIQHRGTGRAIALEALTASLSRDHGATTLPEPSPRAANLLALAAQLPNASAQQLLGDYEAMASLIGQRTAALHQTLAADHNHPVFAPDNFTPFKRRALYQSFRNLTGRTLATLRRQLRHLPETAQADARALLAAEPALLQRFHAVLRRPISGCRIRIHGDYHLEQVLHTDDDLVIIDFEGEPSRPAPYRRLRRSPLHDVVAMLRSFFDVSAAAVALDNPAYDAIAYPWAQWAAATFLRAYQDAIEPTGLIPDDPSNLELLLDTLLLERVLYEVGYELDHRPEHVGIPLHAVQRLLNK